MTTQMVATGDEVVLDPPVFTRPSMRDPKRARSSFAWASWVGWAALILVVLGYAVAGMAGITSPIGTVVVVLVVVVTTPWFGRVAGLVKHIELAGLLRLSLALKLLATLPRYLGRQDSRDYYNAGRDLAESFKSLHFLVDPGRSIPGTGSVRYATGLVEVVTFGDEFATFLVFSLIGFAALVLFVQAFVVALPDIDPRRYIVLTLFWPSLVYWPSSIGKDAVMLLGLSLVAMGVAHVLSHRIRGMVWALPGLVLCGFVRPHVALIAVTAAICAVIIRAHSRGVVGLFVRLSAVAALSLGGAVASNAVESLFSIDGLNPSGLSAALDMANRRSMQGGSAFEAARIDGPLDFPGGFVTVLFRPFPHEAANVAMLITSLEALLLAALVVTAIPRVVSAMRHVRTESYPVYALAFTMVFVYLFSAMGNFGILARQRTMVLPLLLALVALPTAKGRVRWRRLEARS